jgi:erythromycin esterase
MMKKKILMRNNTYYPLNDSKDLDPLMERIGDSRIVMLGEASHGTHEYYTWRSAISRRLIEEKGFDFIAVEGDWPDCYRVNRYVKGNDHSDKSPQELIRTFNRWPTWMWGNWEIVSLVEWMKKYNALPSAKKKAGFYGLDVYSLWESLEALVDYLKKRDEPAFEIAEKALNCFQAAGRDEQNYAARALTDSCKKEAIDLLHEIRRKAMFYNHDAEASLNATQNAHVAVEAEKYYSNMISFDDKTWNIRDRHMMDTLNRLLEFHGKDSKAIVWEHNTHIGDARFTDMKAEGLFNIGQLARMHYSEKNTVLVGFGSYAGKVIAGDRWGAPMRELDVPPARKNSIEEILHNESAENRMIIFEPEMMDKRFTETIPHRAIGVVYHPEKERWNYVPTIMGRRYDAFIYLDETSALHPLHIKTDKAQVPETYPFEV